jgi:hypothetical protein
MKYKCNYIKSCKEKAVRLCAKTGPSSNKIEFVALCVRHSRFATACTTAEWREVSSKDECLILEIMDA